MYMAVKYQPRLIVVEVSRRNHGGDTIGGKLICVRIQQQSAAVLSI